MNGAINYTPAKDANNQDISSSGINTTYAAGPLHMAAAYDSTPTIYSNVGAPALTTGKTNAWHIEGGYSLGSAIVYALLLGAQVNNAGAAGTVTDKDTGWNLNVKVPVGQWTLSAGVGGVKCQRRLNIEPGRVAEF